MDASPSRSPRNRNASLKTALCLTLVFTQAAPLWAGPPLFKRIFAPHQAWGKKPDMNEDYALELTAKNIDWLEHQIDYYGTIVAKVPDVWGEARLTKYRREVEDQLSQEIDDFDKDQINGAQFVSDQFRLAAALSIAAGQPGSVATAPPVSIQNNNLGLGTEPPTDAQTPINLQLDQANGPLSPFKLFGSDAGFDFGENGIQLEQVEVLNQYKRYLDHLNELRRINEGDDTADAPGYAMSLIRVPVSVLPGTKTKQGYGAEITMTATPEIDDDLLPRTFQDLVINDLVDQLSLPLLRVLNNNPKKNREALDAIAQISANREKLRQLERYFKDDRVKVFVSNALSHDFINSFASLTLKGSGTPATTYTINLANKDLSATQFEQAATELARLQKDIQAHNLKPVISLLDESFEMKQSIAALETATRSAVPSLSRQVFGAMPTMNLLQRSEDSQVADPLAEGTAVPDEILEGSERELYNGLITEVREYSPRTIATELNNPKLARLRGFLRNEASPVAAEKMRVAETLRDALTERELEESGRIQINKDVVIASRVREVTADRLYVALGKAFPTANLDVYKTEINAVVDQLQSEVQLSEIDNLVLRISHPAAGLKEAAEVLKTFDVTARTTRRSTMAYPGSNLRAVIGDEEFASLALSFSSSFSVDAVNREVVHLSDVQPRLREELSSAYELLSQPIMSSVWVNLEERSSLVADAVRRGHPGECSNEKAHFLASLGTLPSDLVTTYAWLIAVESAMLSRELDKQVQKQLGGRGALGLNYFGPDPCFESRDQFAQYVMTRWPLKIFTVDPVSTDQNIADVSLVYREMQLAVALSVASGNLGVGSAVNALRQIQREMATIDLNKVAVGFTHGEDTFGWRFYPRFQTPPVEGNLTVFFRDALIGGPTDKHLEMKKEIEPGMRECTALVIMPSFIKGVSIDTRSNWFRLDKPGHTAVSMQDSMKFSRAVEQMRRNVENCVCNEHLYRPGEVARVLNRVRQLDRELPLQSLSCQVPVENALGGFELLSSGARELAPELLGWYGAPGYDVKKGGTFFVIGNNFSVHETRVIAGGQEISSTNPLAGDDCEACNTAVEGVVSGDNCTECEAAKKLLNKPSVTLISRDVMQVTLPSGLPIVRDRRLQQFPDGTLRDGTNDLPNDETPQYLGYVDVHAATPYGVSGHLLIPVLCGEDPCAAPKPSEPAMSAETPDPPSDDTPTDTVEVTGGALSSNGTTLVIAEATSEVGRSEPTLRQLWYDVVRGLGAITLAPNNTTTDSVNVRLAFKIGNVVVGNEAFENLVVNNGTVQLGVAQQLRLLESDGLLFRITAASRELLYSKTGKELYLTAELFVEGAGVKDNSASVTDSSGSKNAQLKFRVITPRAGSATHGGGSSKPSVDGSFQLKLDGKVSANDHDDFGSTVPNPISTWEPLGPVKPVVWESVQSTPRLLQPTMSRRTSSRPSSIRTSSRNPTGKRSSTY